MQLVLRFLATIIGVVGALVALIVDIVASGVHALNGGPQSHGFVGFLLFLVGLIGAFIAIPFPVVAGLFMLVAGLGYIYVAGWGALIASPLLLIAAFLAYRDRNKEEPAK